MFDLPKMNIILIKKLTQYTKLPCLLCIFMIEFNISTAVVVIIAKYSFTTKQWGLGAESQ